MTSVPAPDVDGLFAVTLNDLEQVDDREEIVANVVHSTGKNWREARAFVERVGDAEADRRVTQKLVNKHRQRQGEL